MIHLRDDDGVHVNFWYVATAFGILEASIGDPDWVHLDANSEACMKMAYRKYIVPWVRQLAPRSQDLLKLSFAYILKTNFDFNKIIYSTQDIDMNQPHQPRSLFVWLWDVLYPGTSTDDVDTSDLIVQNDVMKINEFQGVVLPRNASDFTAKG